MNNTYRTLNLPFTLVNSALHAISCLLPGLLLVSHTKWYSPTFLYLFLYVWLACFTINLARTGLMMGKKVNSHHLIVKFVLASVTIVLFTLKTSWNFGLILLAFEFFQWLLIINLDKVASNLQFIFTNVFYYGFVFNLIVMVYDQNGFSFQLMLPLLFAFFLAFTVALTKQLLDYHGSDGRGYVIGLRIISILLAIGSAYYANFSHAIPDWTLYTVAIGLVLTFFFAKLFNNPKKREFVLQSLVLVLLIFYYSVYK